MYASTAKILFEDRFSSAALASRIDSLEDHMKRDLVIADSVYKLQLRLYICRSQTKTC